MRPSRRPAIFQRNGLETRREKSLSFESLSASTRGIREKGRSRCCLIKSWVLYSFDLAVMAL